MKARFHPEAERELFAEAQDERLIHAVLHAVAMLEVFPMMGPLWSEDLSVRRCYVGKPWPYVVVYLPHDDDLLVIAVAHTSRKPGYWCDRIGR